MCDCPDEPIVVVHFPDGRELRETSCHGGLCPGTAEQGAHSLVSGTAHAFGLHQEKGYAFSPVNRR